MKDFERYSSALTRSLSIFPVSRCRLPNPKNAKKSTHPHLLNLLNLNRPKGPQHLNPSSHKSGMDVDKRSLARRDNIHTTDSAQNNTYLESGIYSHPPMSSLTSSLSYAPLRGFYWSPSIDGSSPLQSHIAIKLGNHKKGLNSASQTDNSVG